MAVLSPIAHRHESILELVADVSDEDPLASLRLLHVCGINRFGCILSAAPQESFAPFCDQRDTTITEAFGAIQGLAMDPDNTTHDLHVVAGGARLSSLSRMASASYMGAIFG